MPHKKSQIKKKPIQFQSRKKAELQKEISSLIKHVMEKEQAREFKELQLDIKEWEKKTDKFKINWVRTLETGDKVIIKEKEGKDRIYQVPKDKRKRKSIEDEIILLKTTELKLLPPTKKKEGGKPTKREALRISLLQNISKPSPATPPKGGGGEQKIKWKGKEIVKIIQIGLTIAVLGGAAALVFFLF